MSATVVDDSITGLQTVEVEVAIQDESGNGIAGVSLGVELQPSDKVTLLSAPATDSDGRSLVTLLGNEAGDVTIEIFVDLGGEDVAGSTTFTIGEGACISSRDYFETRLWGPTIQICRSCHNPIGRSRENDAATGEFNDTVMAFPFESDPAFLTIGYDELAALHDQKLPLDDYGMLPKYAVWPVDPFDSHGGGEIITTDSEAFALLRGFGTLLDAEADGRSCSPVSAPDLFGAVSYESDLETANNAKLALTGTPLSPDQFGLWTDQTQLEPVLTNFLANTTPAFGDRLKEAFNDILHVRKFNGAINALNNLGSANGFYFAPLCSTTDSRNCCDADTLGRFGLTCCVNDYPTDTPGTFDPFCLAGFQHANESMVESALETIVQIIEEDRPLNEALSTSTLRVNPFTAKIFNVEPDQPFENNLDPDEWKIASTPPSFTANGVTTTIPHSGILTHPMFLHRYPTSDSNANRARSRWIYKHLLGIDVLGLAKFEAKLSDELIENPTLEDISCSSCHALLDPVAANLKTWVRNSTFLEVNPNWDTCSDDGADQALCYRPAGFNREKRPEEREDSDVTWLGEKMGTHPGFAYAMAQLAHQSLVRDIPLNPPSNLASEDYEAQLYAYLEQVKELQRLAAVFEASNYDFKELMKEVVLGRFYRAKDITTTDPLTLRVAELTRLGRANPLTPEQLSRRIESTVGMKWTDNRREDGDSLLESPRVYRILYGGIDSAGVLVRSTDVTQVMHNVARHMSAHMGCYSVTQDFSYVDPSQRKLFAGVEPETLADTDANENAIKETIKYLHLRLLGEDIDDVELQATFELFEGAAEDSVSASPNNALARVVSSCRARNDYFLTANEQGTLVGAPLDSLEGRREVVSDTSGAIGGWSAVMTYLLSDYRFLYE